MGLTLTPKKAAKIVYKAKAGTSRGVSNPAAKRARISGATPGSAAEGSQPEASPSPAAAERDRAQWQINF